MLKLLIADDEKAILDGLKIIINWKEVNVEIIGTASNGMEALELALNHEPDIVLTDIRMPEMGGLELIKNLSKKLPKTRCIILSGYQEFEYAKQALTYGAVGYLLKPVDENELIELLCSIREKMMINSYERDKLETTNLNIEESTDTEGKSLIFQVKKYIDENYSQQLTLNMISDKFFIHPSYFSRLFKKETGENFIDYLTKKRLEEGKKLILGTNLKIYEIADKLGYGNPKYFSQIFEKHIGIGPKEYRSLKKL